MDWRAALALVKSQQQLLNEVLKETGAVPLCQSEEKRVPKRPVLVSPAIDAVVDVPRPAVEECQLRGRAVSLTADDDTKSEGSSCAVADDILGTPRPKEEETSELSPLVQALSEGCETVIAPIPSVKYATVDSFVNAVFGGAEEYAQEGTEPPRSAVARDAISPRPDLTLAAAERKARLTAEREADLEQLQLRTALSRGLAALECRCAAEHSLLDAAGSEVMTLEAYRRRYMAACAAEMQSTLPASRR